MSDVLDSFSTVNNHTLNCDVKKYTSSEIAIYVILLSTIASLTSVLFLTFLMAKRMKKLLSKNMLPSPMDVIVISEMQPRSSNGNLEMDQNGLDQYYVKLPPSTNDRPQNTLKM